MYSGSTLTRYSGRALGAHQKINRVARKHLNRLLSDQSGFPKTRFIQLFEGKNGPDAIKRKSPARDEPWHYYSPFNESDTQLISLIEEHYDLLVQELRAGNEERAAFEAAWLSHAIVDGLTPAHHYPYEEKLVELRGGLGIESRTTIKDKLIIPGPTRRQLLKNNWKMWGPKGLFTTHGLFEIGVAFLIAPLKFNQARPSKRSLQELKDNGMIEIFKRSAKEIAVLDMYERFYKRGWTPSLAWEVRNKLGPSIVRMVTLAWYSAYLEAKQIDSNQGQQLNSQKGED